MDFRRTTLTGTKSNKHEKENRRRNDRLSGKLRHFRGQKGYHARRKGDSPLPQFLLPPILATTIPTGIRGVNAKSYLP